MPISQPRRTAEEFFYQGILNLQWGNYKDAIKDFDQAIELDPNDPVNYANRGTAKLSLNHNNAAIKDFDKAIELRPDFAQAYYNRALLKERLNQIKEAIKDYNQAIELQPEFPEAYYNRGILLKNLGQYKAAYKDYSKVIEFDSKHAKAFFRRGDLQETLGNKNAALSDYTQAIKLKNDFADAYFYRGYLQDDFGYYQEAYDDYSKVIELKLDYEYIYYNRGLVLDKLGRNEEALADFKQAVKVEPTNIKAVHSRGSSYEKLGKFKQALKDFDRIIKVEPNNIEAWRNRALAKIKSGKPKSSLKDFNKVIELSPNYAQAIQDRAVAHNMLGNYESALDDLNRAIKLEPNFIQALSNRASLLKRLGKLKAALKDYNKLLNLEPENADTYFDRALIKNELGQKDAAANDFTQALKLKPALKKRMLNITSEDETVGFTEKDDLQPHRHYNVMFRNNPFKPLTNLLYTLGGGLVQSIFGDPSTGSESNTEKVPSSIDHFDANTEQQQTETEDTHGDSYSQQAVCLPNEFGEEHTLGITCQGEIFRFSIIPQMSSSTGIVVSNEPVNIGESQFSNCRPIELNGRSSVVCDTNNNFTVIYNPYLERPPCENLDGNIMLGRLLCHWGSKLYQGVTQKISGTTESVTIDNELPVVMSEDDFNLQLDSLDEQLTKIKENIKEEVQNDPKLKWPLWVAENLADDLTGDLIELNDKFLEKGINQERITLLNVITKDAERLSGEIIETINNGCIPPTAEGWPDSLPVGMQPFGFNPNVNPDISRFFSGTDLKYKVNLLYGDILGVSISDKGLFQGQLLNSPGGDVSVTASNACGEATSLPFNIS